MRAFLCLFGDDTLGVVLYFVDSQSVVQISNTPSNTYNVLPPIKTPRTINYRHFPNLLPDLFLQCDRRQDLHLGAVFEDLPFDFSKVRHREHQTKASIGMDGLSSLGNYYVFDKAHNKV